MGINEKYVKAQTNRLWVLFKGFPLPPVNETPYILSLGKLDTTRLLPIIKQLSYQLCFLNSTTASGRANWKFRKRSVT